MGVHPVRGHPWRWVSLGCLAGIVVVFLVAPGAVPVAVLLFGASVAFLLVDRASGRP